MGSLQAHIGSNIFYCYYYLTNLTAARIYIYVCVFKMGTYLFLMCTHSPSNCIKSTLFGTCYYISF